MSEIYLMIKQPCGEDFGEVEIQVFRSYDEAKRAEYASKAEELDCCDLDHEMIDREWDKRNSLLGRGESYNEYYVTEIVIPVE